MRMKYHLHLRTARVFILLLILPGIIAAQGIIIDHTCTDITQIPDTWISKVKSMLKIHYAHTSHGEQITEGLERLSNSDSKYAFYPQNCTVPQTSDYLSLMEGHEVDGYCETYITPEYYWQGAAALNMTRSALNTQDINVSLWAWCTQLDYYSQGAAQGYLDAMAQLESEYPGVTFIYLTGNAQSSEQNRVDRNNQIRSYCRNNNKVLFDFADLDCWYNGEQYTEDGIPLEHPQYWGDQGGHASYASCDNKAKAFWWLLARIAGWDGGAGSGGGGAIPAGEPFGSFDTPVHGSTVRSSIPVTGWALDDSEVSSVKIYRAAGDTLVYIGDAHFAEGARPDVEQSFPDYPYNNRAGWGYMMLTNFLPGGGNGTFTLHAIAADNSGNQVTLGTKTITCDNANAVKPFGAIDTPTQGGTASGAKYVNFGWVLTPQPNRIPENASTIDVYIDGAYAGQPVYNIYRSDIASLFPGYANSNGAVGYFYLDTTAYDNGVHTIQWTAADNAGNTDGIGSRYFTIQNPGNRQQSRAHSGIAHHARMPLDAAFPCKQGLIDGSPVNVKKGYQPNTPPQTLYPGADHIIRIESLPMQRLVIGLESGTTSGGTSWRGYRLVNGTLRKLPTGSTLRSQPPTFYWQPGAGFLGVHELLFVKFVDGTGSGMILKKIAVHIQK
jgi:hypothetical protein